MEEGGRFEWAWCVQGMQSKPRSQEQRVLLWVSQRRRNLKMGLTMRSQDMKDLVLPSSHLAKPFATTQPFKGRLKTTSSLSVPMYSSLYKELLEAEGPSSLLPLEQRPVSRPWLCPGLGSPCQAAWERVRPRCRSLPKAENWVQSKTEVNTSTDDG